MTTTVTATRLDAGVSAGYASGERTRLMSWRVAGIALATLASGAVAPLVVWAAGGGLPGHRVMGLVVGAVIVAGHDRRLGAKSGQIWPETRRLGDHDGQFKIKQRGRCQLRRSPEFRRCESARRARVR